MSNQSSSSVVVMFRAFVMLAFLIGVPALALLNTNVSDVLRQLAERHLGITFHGGTGSSSLSEAPLYAGANGPAAASGPGSAPPDAGSLAPPVVSLPDPTGTPPAGLTNPTTPPASLAGAAAPAANPQAALAPAATAPPATPPSAAIQPAAFVAPSSPPPAMAGMRADPAVVPAGYQASADPRLMAAPTQPTPNSFANPASRETGESGESLRRIQQRLRELGANYVLLESFGNQGLYRFYCKMAMGGNGNYTRYFEATDADPVHAMSTVLQQVENWRAGR